MAKSQDPDPIPLDLSLPELDHCEGSSPFETTELGYCLVTGGAGYLGRNLAFELIRRGETVRIFDREPIDFSHERLDFVQGDVRRLEDVRKACEGIDTVFHTAAVLDFVGFASAQRCDRSFAVNVVGVENVVCACVEAGVKRLVHTSSNNVTFDGPAVDGDESLPYATDPKDLYTETKILGEEAALAGNGRGGLLTCAIRPGGIYGPGDRLLLWRIVEECAAGKFVVTFGDGTAKADNTYIDDLVDSEIEAARHLLPGAPLCGQAYFITDGAPLNYFEFFRPFVEGMGFRYPKLRLPASWLYAVAWVWEFLHWAIAIPPPAFTRLEVRGFTVTHTSRIDKAKRDFGWEPKVGPEEIREACLTYCRELLQAGKERVDRPRWGWWVAIPLGMALLAVLAFEPGAHALWSESVTRWTPRWMLQGVFIWAVLIHVYKGMKAVRMAERAGLHQTSLGWGWQTFALGFPSLSLLQRRVEQGAPQGREAPEDSGRPGMDPRRADPSDDESDRDLGYASDGAPLGLQSLTERIGGSLTNVRWLLPIITVAHRSIYRMSNGRVGDRIGNTRILLLTHIGRRTGRRHVTPLLYVGDGDRWIVAASNAGDDRNPDWWHNLVSQPEAQIQVRADHYQVKARRASEDECELLWPRFVASYRHFARYRRTTRREIPVVVLERAA
jgi:3beta-hydroxy-delta5-steroid dehydrogenase/steroid delta-isomerase